MLCCPERLSLRPSLRALVFVPAVTLSLVAAKAASPPSVPTIARLRALPPPATPDVVAVAGHSVPGDGGGGSFRFDRLSRAIDNDGTIVAPLAGGPGRWIRVYGRDLSVKWFGAKGDGRTFDTASIQSAVDAVRPGETLHFPVGVYRIESDRGVKLKSEVRLDLGTATLTGSNVAGARCRLLEIQGRRNILISGGTLVGSRLGSPQWGVGIFASDAQNLFIEGVQFRNFYFDGILLTGNRGCQQVVIRGVVALDNRRSGLTVAAGSGITVTDSAFQASRGQSPEAGANVEPADGAAVQNVRFSGCSFTRNAGNGLYVHRGKGGSVFGATVVDSLVQGNGNGIVVADTDQVTIARNRVVGHNGPARSGIAVGRGTRHGISDNELLGNRRGILTADATEVDIRDNTVVGTGPNPQGGEGSGVDGDGIVCRGTRSPVTGACVVDGNHVRACAGSGILTHLVARVRVAGNIVEQTGQSGILTRYTSSSHLEDNVVSGIGQEAPRHYDAINLLQYSDANVVTRNVLRLGSTANRAVGVSANSRGNRVFANVVLP
jgi:nitrous oxidase accessory protein NosD